MIVTEHVGELILAEHAVVYEYTGEAVADSTVEEHGSHGRVNTATETEYHTVVAEGCLQLSHCAFDKRLRAPRALGTAYAHSEVFQQTHAALAVVHLGVELHAPHAGAGFESCQMYFGGRRYPAE